MAPSCVPALFPPVEGRYVDGEVGAYANPCCLATYEVQFCPDWDPAETTLISLGAGRARSGLAMPTASGPGAGAAHCWARFCNPPTINRYTGH